jgi:cobalt/nickel transport system permease protein
MLVDDMHQCSQGRTAIYRVDARVKLLSSLALVGMVVSVPSHWWWAYVAVAAIVLSVVAASAIPPTYFLKRLAWLLPFLTLIALGAPLSQGAGNGWPTAGMILVRAILALTVMMTLIATTPYRQLIVALEQLHVPRILIWILAFMYRYMFVVADELTRLRRAKLARTFHWNLGMELRLIGNFTGVLFIRAFERAERVYASMCARGWNGEAE